METTKRSLKEKCCKTHDIVQGPVNRTEKEVYTVRRNRKCPDCGKYYWTEERTVNAIQQRNNDNREEKMELIMMIEKMQAMLELIARQNTERERVKEKLEEMIVEF